MDIETIKKMLYSFDYDIRQLAYGMMGGIAELIDDDQKKEIRNILEGFIQNEMYIDTTEFIQIEKSKETLN